MSCPLPQGGMNSVVWFMLRSLCVIRLRLISSRDNILAQLLFLSYPASLLSWEPSLNKSHALESSTQPQNPLSASREANLNPQIMFLSSHLTFNSTFWLLDSSLGCVYRYVCFSWAVVLRTKIPDIVFLSHVGWLYLYSAPTLSPTGHLLLGLVTDWKSSISRKRKIPQFILQYGHVRLKSSSGASWKRNAWGLSLVPAVPRDYSHIIYCDICLCVLPPSETVHS